MDIFDIITVNIIIILIGICILIYRKLINANKQNKKNIYESIEQYNKLLKLQENKTVEVKKESEKEIEEATKEEKKLIPYRRTYLLTKNELYFYKKLKDYACKYNYSVLSKIRLADIVEVNKEINKNEYLKYFSKISSKHIDFALCNPDNLYIIYLIELEDSSHKKDERIERDKFVEEILNKCKYKYYKVKSIEELKTKIEENENKYALQES